MILLVILASGGVCRNNPGSAGIFAGKSAGIISLLYFTNIRMYVRRYILVYVQKNVNTYVRR